MPSTTPGKTALQTMQVMSNQWACPVLSISLKSHSVAYVRGKRKSKHSEDVERKVKPSVTEIIGHSGHECVFVNTSLTRYLWCNYSTLQKLWIVEGDFFSLLCSYPFVAVNNFYQAYLRCSFRNLTVNKAACFMLKHRKQVTYEIKAGILFLRTWSYRWPIFFLSSVF